MAASTSMSSTTTSPSAPRKRSRDGCNTCIKSKVKCSEIRPICQRCTRLGKQCFWPTPKQPLREMRRGSGAIKKRESFSPKALVPSLETSPRTIEGRQQGFTDVGQATGESPHELFRAHEQDEELTHYDGSRATLITPFDTAQRLYFMDDDTIHDGWLSPFPSLDSPLSAWGLHSSCSLMIGEAEHSALSYYQHVYSRSFAPKEPIFSIFNIVLRYGTDSLALMHLLLAASFGQMSWTSRTQSFWIPGKSHFISGTKLLTDVIRGDHVDHCQNLSAFWLLQTIFFTVHEEEAFQSLGRLSRSLAEYVKTHHILELYSWQNVLDPQKLLSIPSFSKIITIRDKSVLAKFMIFLFYADLEAEFCHAGGEFSQLFASMANVPDAVYQASRNCLEHFFGDEYPHHEIIDDIERSFTLDLHFQMALVLRRINEGANTRAEASSFENIERDIVVLKENHASVFRIADDKTSQGTKLASISDTVTAHFHSVRLYNLQCLRACSNSPFDVRIKLRGVLRELQLMAHRVNVAKATILTHKDQWPLFIAGIETEDPIHAEWIAERLEGSRYAVILQKVKLAQEKSGTTLDIHEVRELFVSRYTP